MCAALERSGGRPAGHAAFDFGQFFLIGTHNGGQTPGGHRFEISFPGPAWLNGGELGTEASVFMVPAVIATLVYVGWFLRGKNDATGKAEGR